MIGDASHLIHCNLYVDGRSIFNINLQAGLNSVCLQYKFQTTNGRFVDPNLNLTVAVGNNVKSVLGAFQKKSDIKR